MLPFLYSDMLLFSKELQPYPKRRLLYFAQIDTIDSPQPVLHRFATDEHQFDTLKLGGVYALTTSDARLISHEYLGRYALGEEDYMRLMTCKGSRFFSYAKLSQYRALGIPLYSPYKCYPLSELKVLLEFEEGWLHKLLVRVIAGASQFFAAAVLIALYVFLMFSFANMNDYSNPATTAAVMLICISGMPLIIFALAASHMFVELFLYKWDFTRWSLMKRHVLLNGGERKHLKANEAVRRIWLIRLGVSLFILALGVLAATLFGSLG
jgi:hypothetical protein